MSKKIRSEEEEDEEEYPMIEAEREEDPQDLEEKDEVPQGETFTDVEEREGRDLMDLEDDLGSGGADPVKESAPTAPPDDEVCTFPLAHPMLSQRPRGNGAPASHGWLYSQPHSC